MNTRQRIEEFLAKARQAEEQASRCKDAQAKRAWEAIAKGYRALARQNEYGGG